MVSIAQTFSFVLIEIAQLAFYIKRSYLKTFCSKTTSIINAIVFLGVSIGINLVKNKFANTVLSVISILIWSIVIDTVCYYLYPLKGVNQTLCGYVFQGILFNYKYVFSNALVICLVNLTSEIKKKLQKNVEVALQGDPKETKI